jgi:inhibitor of cysteine peptidase
MTVTLTEHDDGGRVRVHTGETIEICLPEIATAGYRWSVDDIDTSLFDVSEVSAEYPQGAIGSGGQACVRVTARSPGNGTVRLKYGRPWEGADGILKRFAVDVEAVPN